VWLWDANIVRAFSDRNTEGHDPVLERADRVGWDEIALPIVVAAELLDGRLSYLREAHRRTPQHLLTAFERIDATVRLLTLFPIVGFDAAALRVYRQRQLFPGTMSRDDRLIASICVAGQHRLVTRNVADFAAVPGLVVENWIDEPLS
jgi:predicted nucleic acid-binding protein